MRKNSRFIYRQAGFTLIEIMVVMAIIAVLAALSVGSYRSSQIKARDAERKNDLKQISNSLEVYYNDKGQYPVNSIDGKINGCVSAATCDWDDAWVDENGTTYMVELPGDTRSYLNYYYSSDGTSFQIYARLENDLDIDVPTSGGNPGNYTISCGDPGYNCNYGVSSTNMTVGEGRTVNAD
jgi:prepilin-type N-terminal cleavage/methylation domain-containing protein